MPGLLEKTYYGNTIQQWLLACLVVLAAFIIGKLLLWFFKNIAKAASQKSRTRLDDLILDMIEEPLVFAVVIAGIWFGLSMLAITDDVWSWLERGFYFLIVFNVAWLLVRVMDALTEEYIVPLIRGSESQLDDQLLPIIRKGLRTTVWVIAGLVALDNAGYDVKSVLAGLGIGGLAFALAAQDTVGNLFGGFTIFMDKPFTIGDRVKVMGFDGIVREVGIRTTRIQTLEGRTVSIPNSAFTQTPVENVSSEPSRKVVLGLGLTYDTDEQGMQQAIDILKGIIAGNDHTAEKVLVAFDSFGDFALGITLIYYIKKGADIFGTKTAVNLAILQRFNEAGLEMAFPTQTIHLSKPE